MQKRLYRSHINQRLAGVCGGLGEFFGIDPFVFRFLFVWFWLQGLQGGAFIYFVLWVFIPLDSK